MAKNKEVPFSGHGVEPIPIGLVVAFIIYTFFEFGGIEHWVKLSCGCLLIVSVCEFSGNLIFPKI